MFGYCCLNIDNSFSYSENKLGDNFIKFFKSKKLIEKEQFYIAVVGHITRLLDVDQRVKHEYDIVSIINDYYKKYGALCYKYWDGDFLIIYADKKTRKIMIWNNRYQTTKLYYWIIRDRLYFSSSIVEFLNHLDYSSIKANKASIRSFISNGFTITDQTQIMGIRKLLPTSRIEIINGKYKILDHWDEEFSFARKKITSLENHLDRYEELYQEGILDFLEHSSTKELGTLMSGGHDTSFVMIQSSKVYKKPIHAFTTTFPNWGFDEGKYAKNITEKFGGIYHGIPFVPEDLDYMVSLIRANDEPVVGSSLPLHVLGMKAAKIVDTMFAGDGGDTLWGEYYPVAEYHRYVKHLPLFLRRFTHSITKVLRDIFDWERFWELEHVASLFTENNYYSGFMRKLCTYRHFTDEMQYKLFNSDFITGIKPASSIHEVSFSQDNFREALIEGKLFNAFYTYQAFHTINSMEHFGMKFYMPTINKKVMDFITTLPYEYVNGGNSFQRLTNSKKINRRFHKLALARYLDKYEIYNRSFDIPWYNILRPRPVLLERLKQRLHDRGWYNNDFLDQLFMEFKGQAVKPHELLELKHHGYRIFTLLSLEVWAIEYLDGRLTEKPDRPIPLEEYLL